ncbi:MAG: protein-L-isoaspartate O-methyltransferase [Rhizomicrobium sp.]|jgi:protein-L-isoaspartate(D-aspartate) O-methyltransferase
MPDYAEQRFNMVASQVLASGVTDERILAAMSKIERERFVPTAKRLVAYSEAPIEVVARRYLIDPRTFSLLLNAAEIESGDKILDVGCVTGYSTAVLSEFSARVIGLEQDADLVRISTEMMQALGRQNAVIVQGSLTEGFKGEAPYDVIVVNGGIEFVPQAMLAQLASGGRLAAVVGKEGQSKATVFVNENGRMGHRVAFDASVPMLAGFRQAVGFVF